jgi:glycerophosphoryl diester phosphodiesterase
MKKFIMLFNLWFKEYFSGCKAQPQFIDKNELFLICGHRGSPVKEIENTIPSFERALKEGANSLEVDLSLTKDDEIVLWHDWNPNETKALLRESGFEPWVKYKPHPPEITSSFRKPVKELTLNEFKENFGYKLRKASHRVVKAEIPTLSEFINWAKNKKELKAVFFDIKAPASDKELAVKMISQLKKLIEENNISFKTIIETAENKIIEVLKEKFPGFDYSIDIEPPLGFILEPRDYSSVEAAIKNKTSFAIALRPRKITIANFTTFRRIIKYDVRKRVEHNKNNPSVCIERVIGCTVNKRKELNCVVKLGIGGVQTDFPSRLKKIAMKYGKVVE